MDAELSNLQTALSVVRVGGVITAAGVLLIAYLLAKGITSVLTRLGDRLTERRLLLGQVAAFSRFAIYLLATVLAVGSAIELRSEAVLALSGTVGVALGFAFKDLAAAVLAGLTILIDKPFQVGDRIAVGDVYGEVRAIGLRSVRLVTLDDNLVTIPNSKLMTDVVASSNAGELTMLVQMDFYIGAEQDPTLARALVQEALTASRYCHLSGGATVLVNQVIEQQHLAIRLRAKAYVVDTQYEKAFETDVTLRVMAAFSQANIQPPAQLHRRAEAS